MLRKNKKISIIVKRPHSFKKGFIKFFNSVTLEKEFTREFVTDEFTIILLNTRK